MKDFIVILSSPFIGVILTKLLEVLVSFLFFNNEIKFAPFVILIIAANFSIWVISVYKKNKD